MTLYLTVSLEPGPWFVLQVMAVDNLRVTMSAVEFTILAIDIYDRVRSFLGVVVQHYKGDLEFVVLVFVGVD